MMHECLSPGLKPATDNNELGWGLSARYARSTRPSASRAPERGMRFCRLETMLGNVA